MAKRASYANVILVAPWAVGKWWRHIWCCSIFGIYLFAFCAVEEQPRQRGSLDHFYTLLHTGLRTITDQAAVCWAPELVKRGSGWWVEGVTELHRGELAHCYRCFADTAPFYVDEPTYTHRLLNFKDQPLVLTKAVYVITGHSRS